MNQVPNGLVVASGYVPVHDVVIYATPGHELNPAAVERAYRNLLALGGDQPWPCPVGEWMTDGRFMLRDGRHRYVAALMLGYTHLLVAWTVPGSAA